MNTNLNALRSLYVALGGQAADVADCTTNVDVLNAISKKFGGADNANLNPAGIDNIAAVAENIIGGITPTGTKQITSNGTHDVTNYASAEVAVSTALETTTVSIAKQPIDDPFSSDITVRYTNSSGVLTTVNVSEAREDLTVAKNTIVVASTTETNVEVSTSGGVEAYMDADGVVSVAVLSVGNESHYTITFTKTDETEE